MTVTISDKRNRKTTFQVIFVKKIGDHVFVKIEDFNKLQCIFPLLFDTLSGIKKATRIFYNMFKK